MAWTISLTDDAKADLKNLGVPNAKRVLRFLHERLGQRDNPREIGNALQGPLRDYWRYRVGDYRIICRLEDSVITVFVIHIRHRREAYKAAITE
jgi:mRNA interferase RelE/StbE